MEQPLLAYRPWFDWYLDQVQQNPAARPLPTPPHPLSAKDRSRVTCPCCGYPTLHARRAYDICELCSWEDDGQDDSRADEVWGGPNSDYSLAEARRNFGDHLTMYGPDHKDRGRALAMAATDYPLKQNLRTAFDALVGETDPARLVVLWDAVVLAEAALRQALHDRVKEWNRTSGRRSSAPGPGK